MDYEEDFGEEECQHGAIPAELCDKCDENGCNWSEDEPYCNCYYLEDLT